MEVLLKIPNSFQGYYKKPEKTAAKLVNGWIASGDSGSIDENSGQLVIYDRLEYMLNLKDGTKYSPSYIRNAVKFCPYVKECVVIGGEDRDYIMAILTIDFEALGRWAEKRKIPFTTMSDLSQRNEIYELIEPEIRRVNKVLPRAAQIKRFLIFYKEFDADEGEMTRTRKVKKAFIEQRYHDLIDAAFAGKSEAFCESVVKYRDGASHTISVNVKIRDVSE